MIQFSGKSVCPGIALGPVALLKKKGGPAARREIKNPGAEIAKVLSATRQAKSQLEELCRKAQDAMGESSAAILEAHQMLLEDAAYQAFIENVIQTQRVNAAYAVAAARKHFSEMFAGMDDDYMQARADDIKDISDRLLCILEGWEEPDFSRREPFVLVADDLSPSQTLAMDKEKILAIVTVHGSANSHTAILARTMNIPALVGVPLNLDEIQDKIMAVADGFEGTVTFNPDEAFCARVRKRAAREREEKRLLAELKEKDDVTVDGKTIRLCANIASVSDAADALKNGARGVGLFRSEFLYLGRNDFPTEEEQLQAYKQAAQAMAGKKTIIRTLDIGADKQADYFHLEKEENPAMGCRAIRICLKRPDIFKTQLRALLRAAATENIAILYPMITSVEEVRQIFAFVKEAQTELERSGIPCRCPEQGIMIETPAAALISDELAQLADFFSIGTNDLTQYALAIDRQNPQLADFYNPCHKAILRMIQMTTENAHKYGKWVSVCGELGADPALTETFIRMGVDELSMAPSMILKIRKVIRQLHIEGD